MNILVNSLSELGITVFDQRGELRCLSDILHDITNAYRKIEGVNEPLLTIELQDETSVPKVFYKGEEIEYKTRVSFDWETEGCMPDSGGTKLNIEHLEANEQGPIKKGIGLYRGKYAHD